MVGVCRLFSISLLVLILIFPPTGCRESQTLPDGLEATPDAILPATPQAVPLSGLLPSPAALPPRAPAKRASYVEADLVMHAEDFASLLPNANVAPGTNRDAHFTTSWTGADGSGLGFCLYDFSIVDYDRPPEINYGWLTPPADISMAWIGLANWGENRWDWFSCHTRGRTGIPGFASYFDGGGRLVAAVVLADSGTSRLRWIHVGPPQVEAVLETWPNAGVLPVTVTCTTINSTTAVGEMENHDWDWNGDGTFDENTGGAASASHEYPNVGVHNLAVRITTSYGIQMTAEASVDVVGHWEHTLGVAGHEAASDIGWDGRDHLYVVGSQYMDETKALFLAKLDLRGNLVWARAWDALGHEGGKAVVADSSGNVFVVGETSSYGAGDQDVLLQLWDSEGNLQWTRTWGGVNIEAVTAMARRGDGLYIAGYSNSLDYSFDGLLVKFNTAGDLQWGRLWSPYFTTRFTDITTSFQILTGTSAHLTGFGSDNNKDWVIYLSVGSDGHMRTGRYWAGGDYLSGNSIVVSSLLPFKAYIMGTMSDHDGDTDVLLLDIASDTAKTWGTGNQEYVTNVVRVGGNLYGCGSTTSLTPGKNQAMLLKMTMDGAFLGATALGYEIGESGFDASICLPGGGIYACGDASRADGCVWQPLVGEMEEYTSPWVDEVSPVFDYAGAVASPTGGVVHVLTDMVIDTGAGATDKLVVGRSLP